MNEGDKYKPKYSSEAKRKYFQKSGIMTACSSFKLSGVEEKKQPSNDDLESKDGIRMNAEN